MKRLCNGGKYSQRVNYTTPRDLNKQKETVKPLVCTFSFFLSINIHDCAILLFLLCSYNQGK